MTTHNIHFRGDIRKYSSEYPCYLEVWLKSLLHGDAETYLLIRIGIQNIKMV